MKSHSFLPIFHTVLFGKKSLCVSHALGMGAASHFLQGGAATYILWMFLHGRLVSSPFIHLFIIIYFYEYRLKDIYSLLGFIIQYYLIYFVAQMALGLAIGSSFSCFLFSFDTPPSCGFFVFLSTYFLVLPDAPGSSYMFSTPVQE